MSEQREGEGTDGKGSPGMVEEKSRPARAGETDTTRLGMLEEGDDTDGAGSGGMVDKQDAAGSSREESR